MKTKNIISQGPIQHNQNIDLRLLVTPYQNKRLPVYDWYNYKHSFSHDLVIKLIGRVSRSVKFIEELVCSKRKEKLYEGCLWEKE